MTEKTFWKASVVVLLAFAAAFKAQGAAVQPVNLRCEERVNPLGIGNPNPELSWQLQSTGQGTAYRGLNQTAYQIQVGSTSGAADLWDSGKVASSRTVDIVYGGRALTSGQQYFWQVRVYDGSNNVSAWSAPAFWSMGLLSPTNWSAQWIGYDAAYNLTAAQTTSNSLFNTSGLSWISYSGQTAQGGVYSSALRKQIVLPVGQTITNAIMALYADNACSVYVNGQQMSNSAVRWDATAWINVTASLHAGTNELALYATSTDAQEGASAIGRLVVQFASGSVTNIPLDTSWKAAQWPTGNWTATNYNDSSWATPSSGGTPWGTPSLNDSARVPAPYLRKNFTVGQAVTRATVYVTALGAYELHLNGQKVGNDVLTPGWTQFTKRVYYQTYDVTSMVQSGSNTISAILGDGWYASVLAFTGHRQYYGGTPRFLAQLVIQFSDGSTQTVATDNSWKASYGPIQWGDLLIGSGYDARLEMPGWDTTNFNDAAWSPVLTGLNVAGGGYSNVTAIVTGLESNNQLNFMVNNTTMGGDPAYGITKTLQINFTLGGTNQTLSFAEGTTVQLGGGGQTLSIIQALYGFSSSFPGTNGLQVQAAVTEPSRRLETLAASNLTQPTPGCYTFDLGQNMVGWVQLNISGSAGDRIAVRHGEMLNPNGTVYTANLRGADATDFYIFGTNGSVVFEPRFTFHGFRYVEVRGLSVPPTLNSVTGVVVHSDVPQAGSFSCSSPLVNQLFSNIIWSHKGNYVEVPTDCPQRDERMGYTGDTEMFAPTAVYNFDVQTFFRRWLTTLCQDSQNFSDSYPDVAPYIVASSQSGSAGWEDAGWICPYLMYKTYGDTNVIADNYSSLTNFGQWLAGNASNFVISSLPNDLEDWLNIGGGASEQVIDTAYYAGYAQAMSEMAAAIGNNADAAAYSALHSNIVAAFGNFFGPNGAFTDGSSQTGYALAFTLNLVPPALRGPITQQFANTIANYNNHLVMGFIGTPRLLPALHAAGRDDLAYTLLLQQTYPSWLYPVTLGATTMWETWNSWTPGGGFNGSSFNHYALGGVGQYLYSEIGGINAASPGYSNILIQPVPGVGLTWANTSYNSTRGPISTDWTNIGNVFNLAVVIPPNTTAQVYVPTTNATAITESGVPAASAPGVSYLGASNNYAVYAVGSGSYLWSSPFQILPPNTGISNIVITMTNQTAPASGSYPFTPTWSVETNGDLILRATPASSAGNFNLEPSSTSRSVNSLTSGGSLTINSNGNPVTTSGNYVTCGNGGGAGSSLVYLLTNSATGYNLTNITVYGGWKDNGRDQQAYTIYYSTVAAPTNFIYLTSVGFNPAAAGQNIADATRVMMMAQNGVLASNVAEVKFDFTSPASENGYCGYAGITIFGTPGISPALPAALNAKFLTPTSFVMNISNLVAGRNYTLQSTTNLTSGIWTAETNFVAATGAVAFTNFTATTNAQKFYRILGY